MKELEKLRQWLLTFPGLGRELTVDYLGAGPGSTGLFPAGLEETSRREDLLGNVQVACRYQFTLYRRMAPGQDSAQWFLDFQNWVQQQSVAGLAPRFGDVPDEEWLLAQKGKSKELSASGIGTCAVTLTAEFIRNYDR